ncbi:MAG TPA: tricarballylate utilization 4Fe-4S protein TcuB [Alphaproteobacteria bacterium]
MRATEATADARRFMEICNACRYCEGYCAVFPAMELRREFSDADLSYLANLCHNCRGCFYACQYAPPHEFGINLPKAFAQIRAESYEEYAWPRPLAGLFKRNGLVVSLVAALAIAVALILTMLWQSPDVVYGRHTGSGAFYAVIPYGVMVTIASITFVYALVALAMGFVNFWRDTARPDHRVGAAALWQALSDIFTLRNLGGGGHGCNDRDETFSQSRRWLHHAMFYGFLACFASTSVATVYHHWLGWVAPYAFLSLPVVLGTLGGLGLMVGTTGLFWMKLTADQEPAARELLGADAALLVLLDLAAFTGLLLLVLRASGAMGVLLALHLGVILALFLVLPYGKFVHGVYRAAALLLYAIERRTSAAAHAG